MAKNPRGDAHVEAHTETAPTHMINIGSPLVVKFGADEASGFEGFSIDIDSLAASAIAAGNSPFNSIRYLIQHGFGKSLQDTIGGVGPTTEANVKHYNENTGTEKEREAGKAAVEKFGTSNPAECAIAAVRDRMATRVQKIIDGEMGEASTRGPRASTSKVKDLAFFAREVGLEMLRAAAKAKGKKLPTGDGLAQMVTDLLASRHGESINAKAQARLDAYNATTADTEALEDLFA